MLCCAALSAGGGCEGVRARDGQQSCRPERGGQGQGRSRQMMYACSGGMSHSWSGAHSQNWRWMPGRHLGG